MKNIYQFIVVLAIIFCGNQLLAQNVVLYGLQNNNISNDPNVPLGGPMELVSIDGVTGQVSPLFEIGTSAGVSLGSSTYDHQNQRYIFWGVNTSGEERLYIINTITGELTENTYADRPLEMEYDLQNQLCYGLKQQGIGHPEFVSIDLNTGEMTGIAQMPYVSGINLNSSTFDSNNGRFFFVGVDQSFQNRLYVIDAATGNLLHDSLIPNDYYLNTIEYNENNDQLYGIKRVLSTPEPDSLNPFPETSAAAYLAVVDPQSGALSLVNNDPFLSGTNWGYVLGGTGLDKNSQLFVMRWNDGGTQKLLLLDVLTGTIVSDVAESSLYVEIQTEQTIFGSTFFQWTGLKESFGNQLDFSTYPNPTTSLINIEYELNKAQQIEVVLYSTSGKKVKSQFVNGNTGANLHTLKIKGLPSASYFIGILNEAGELLARQQLMIR